MIDVVHLSKHYRVFRRPPGLGPAIRSLFHRSYETVRAVEDIGFSIADGERVGFLGPNGAGKTTTLKVLAGLLHATSGEAHVQGFRPSDRRPEYLRQMMLLAGQKQQLIWDLAPSETFELNRAIYGVPRKEFEETRDELVTLLQIGDLVNKPTRQLSLGERMKCELVAALLHRPRVLFLDEPTIGLDVTMQATVRRFILDYNRRYQATILLTSHDMDDVAAICERVIVIDKGRLIFQGTLRELVKQTRPEKRIALRLSHPVVAERLATLGKIIEHDDAQAVLQIDQTALAAILPRVLSELPVADLSIGDAPLEEVLSDLFAASSTVNEITLSPLPLAGEG